MKSDIDRLMTGRGLDGLMVVGGEEFNVVRNYMVNGAHITHGLIIKKRDHDPILFVGGMEIVEAAKSGLQVINYAETGYFDLMEEHHDDPPKAVVVYWRRCLEKASLLSGRIGMYGTGQINEYIELARRLESEYPQFQVLGETGTTLFDEAFITKDAEEIARIQSVANRVCEVLEAVWEYIAGHSAEGDQVVNAAGEQLTIGDVKRFIRRELLERELEDTGMIFAQGRDAGFPHSRGEDEMPLRKGQSIVFDLSPRELGGGYYHDVTRTWCIDHAPPEVRLVYDQVMEAFAIALASFALDSPGYLMQEAVLDYFESRGHKTQRSHPGTLEGYVHSLGHGVGLNIHERPSISHLRRNDVFQKGNCVTVEPGLYYPEKGFGVRVEDLFIITDEGKLVSLMPFRKDLTLPLMG